MLVPKHNLAALTAHIGTKWIRIITSSVIVITLGGCDSGSPPDPEQVLTFQLPEVRRSIQNVTATDLELRYELKLFDANGAEVSTVERTVESNAPDLTPDVEVGWQVQYTFDWLHKDFDVVFASAARTIRVEGAQVERPVYSYSNDADGDGSTNEEELNLGYSPVSAQDSPENEFISINSAGRAFVISRSWDRPVFGCRNPPETFGVGDPWYWIFDPSGVMYGIEGSPPQVTDSRGSYIPANQPIITNDIGEQYTWDFNTTAQSMIVIPEDGTRVWGECLRLAGPKLDRTFNVVAD